LKIISAAAADGDAKRTPTRTIETEILMVIRPLTAAACEATSDCEIVESKFQAVGDVFAVCNVFLKTA